MSIELSTLLGKGLARRTGQNFVDLTTIEAIDSVATEAARLAIVQTAAFRGRVVRQTGGYNAGYYIADGAGSWQLIGTALERSAQHVDVREFGAACDGSVSSTGGTDDTTAVRAAVASCIASGRTLYFPGICKITDEIVCNGSITIVGRGDRLGGLHQTTTNARCLVFAPSSNFLPQSIYDMMLFGGKISLHWSAENGATNTAGTVSTMQRCSFFPTHGGVGSRAIKIDISMLGSRHSELTLQNSFEIGIEATNVSVDILGATTWDSVNLTGGTGTKYGIHAYGGGAPGTVWRNLILEGCAGCGMRLENADFTLICPHFEANGILRDEADIELYSVIDGATGPVQLQIFGGVFSGLGPAQVSSKRIEFKSSHCNLTVRDMALSSSHVLQTNGNATACSILWESGSMLTLSPADWGGQLTFNSAGTTRVQALQTDSIAGRTNDYLTITDPISGTLRLTHGTPSPDLMPGLAANGNSRVLVLGINAPQLGAVNASYDSATLFLETRNPYALLQLLGNAAGAANEVLAAFGQRGYLFRHGGMVLPTATGAKTINKGCGSIRIAPGNSTVVLTNNLIKVGGSYNTGILAQLMTVDATAKSVVATRGSGSATFTLNANATAEVEIAWFLYDCGDEVTGGAGINGGQLDFSRAVNSAHI